MEVAATWLMAWVDISEPMKTRDKREPLVQPCGRFDGKCSGRTRQARWWACRLAWQPHQTALEVPHHSMIILAHRKLPREIKRQREAGPSFRWTTRLSYQLLLELISLSRIYTRNLLSPAPGKIQQQPQLRLQSPKLRVHLRRSLPSVQILPHAFSAPTPTATRIQNGRPRKPRYPAFGRRYLASG